MKKSPKVWKPLSPPVPGEALPEHIAIIMDGNGRWAVRQNLLRIRGHEAGAEAVREVVRYCGQIKVRALTLYAFSSENWQRPQAEVRFLMRLLKRYLINEIDELHANGVRMRSVGRVEELPSDVLEELESCKAKTASNTGLNLCLALNYGGHAELVDAAKSLSARAADGEITPEEIDIPMVSEQLGTAGLPPVELLIRTAGEQRVSNFLLWQACDAEFQCLDICWPEFRREHLEEAIHEYAKRRQRA
jgi:undecaprenyl diphosphate synthase